MTHCGSRTYGVQEGLGKFYAGRVKLGCQYLQNIIQRSIYARTMVKKKGRRRGGCRWDEVADVVAVASHSARSSISGATHAHDRLYSMWRTNWVISVLFAPLIARGRTKLPTTVQEGTSTYRKPLKLRQSRRDASISVMFRRNRHLLTRI
jgi:hypothetical protein